MTAVRLISPRDNPGWPQNQEPDTIEGHLCPLTYCHYFISMSLTIDAYQPIR